MHELLALPVTWWDPAAAQYVIRAGATPRLADWSRLSFLPRTRRVRDDDDLAPRPLQWRPGHRGWYMVGTSYQVQQLRVSSIYDGEVNGGRGQEARLCSISGFFFETLLYFFFFY